VSKIYSIKCPNCGAPLSLLGGGRIQTVTCAYCKSVIDLNDNYKILSQFKNVFVPPSPFKIGMQGKIDNIEWTIIGWIVYRDSEDNSDRWSEFLLFSPLYGYAWLVYEDGEISISRRVRDLDLRKWQKEKNKTLFFRGGHYILDNESYYSVIDFVQGELNYIAKYGDRIKCWDYKGIKGQSISIEKSNNELEVYYTKKLDTKEIYNSFKVPPKDQKIKKLTIGDKFHKELDDKKPLSFYGIVAIFITLIIIMMFSYTISSQILYERTSINKEIPFHKNSSAFLTKIELDTPNHKALNSYAISIYQQNKKIFYIDSNSVYFAKQNISNSWNSSAKGAYIFLKLDAGDYILKVEKINNTLEDIKITITERVIRLSYIVPLFILILIFFIYIQFTKVFTITFQIIGLFFASILISMFTGIPIAIILTIAIFLYFIHYTRKTK